MLNDSGYHQETQMKRNCKRMERRKNEHFGTCTPSRICSCLCLSVCPCRLNLLLECVHSGSDYDSRN